MDVPGRAVYTSMHVPLGRQRSEDNLNCHPSGTISSSLWDRVSHWMGMHQVDIMVCQPVQRFLRAGITCAYHRTWLLMWVLEIELGPSSLCDKHFLIESFSQPEIDLGQWHNALQMDHVKMMPSQGVSVHRKIGTYFHCVYACYMCTYVYRCGRPLLSEVRGRGWVSCSLTLCLIPMRQVLSLSLGPNWLPASPRDPSVSVPPSTGFAAACPAMPSCVCVCFWDSNTITPFLHSLSSL